MKSHISIKIEDAPAFIAGLVERGLAFDAVQEGNRVIFTIMGKASGTYTAG